jgi:hypothetical protein
VQAPLEMTIELTTINGNSEGISVRAHKAIPEATHSAAADEFFMNSIIIKRHI